MRNKVSIYREYIDKFSVQFFINTNTLLKKKIQRHSKYILIILFAVVP